MQRITISRTESKSVELLLSYCNGRESATCRSVWGSGLYSIGCEVGLP